MNNIPTSQLGSSNDLTEYDILKLKRMYKCKTTDDDTNDKGPCANLFLESTILTKSYKRNGINSNVWIDPTDSKNAVYKDENLNWCITETYSEDFTCKFYSSSATKTPDLAKDWNYYNDDGDLETVTSDLNFRLSCQGILWLKFTFLMADFFSIDVFSILVTCTSDLNFRLSCQGKLWLKFLVS